MNTIYFYKIRLIDITCILDKLIQKYTSYLLFFGTKNKATNLTTFYIV